MTVRSTTGNFKDAVEILRLLEMLFMGLVAGLAFITGVVSSRKNPRTGMKTSFTILSFLFFLGNLLLLLDSTLFPNLFAKSTGESFSLVLSGSVLVFGLFFPSYFRNLTSLTIATSAFLGALGTTIVLQVFVMNETNPLGLDRFRYLVGLLETITLVFFCFLVTYKLEYSFPSLESFIRFCYAGFLVSFLLFSYLFFVHSGESLFFQNHLGLLYFFDFAFVSCFVAFLIHFTFSEYYLNHPFQFLLEFPTKVFEGKSLATAEGTRGLKQKLWELYDKRNWKALMDSFWFQILVDETLDNALEHGGKRGSDRITVHLYESPKIIEVYVTDMGKGFNPKEIPSPLQADRKMVPSGRGIHILKKLFSVRWNFLGNEICIRINKDKVGEMQSFPPEPKKQNTV